MKKKKDGKDEIIYENYVYYDNPSMSIHEFLKEILENIQIKW